MDYLSRWAEANAAAADFYGALRDAGVDVEGIRLSASTDGRGLGVVRGWAAASSLREVSRLIRLGAGLPSEDEAE